MDGQQHSDLRTGVRAGLPFALATFVLGISFGVLAQPLMGSLAPIVMSVVGVLGGAALAHPERLGLDAIFPAFYLALLVEEARGGRELAAAAAGGAITLALMPVAPPGLPVIAAALAALLGLRG